MLRPAVDWLKTMMTNFPHFCIYLMENPRICFKNKVQCAPVTPLTHTLRTLISLFPFLLNYSEENSFIYVKNRLRYVTTAEDDDDQQ